MTLYHAVVWLDHQSAQVLQFDADHVEVRKVKSHTHHTRQHGSAVRSEHEFFAQVCDDLEGIKEVLVTGSKTGCSDFRHYVEKHRSSLMPQLAGYEVVDRPTENQLVAFARKFFLKYDRMQGTPTPT